MGARGPQPKPAALRLAEGNPSRRPINLADGMNPAVQVPDMPTWLNKEAKKEWKRASVELEALGCIAKIDRAKFAIYCQCFGDLVLLERAMGVQQKRALSAAERSGDDQALAMTAPFFQLTPTGFKRDSALVRRIESLREQVHRYAASFGMDPSSRSRVKPSDNQLPLPGMEAPAANEEGAPRLRDFA